MRHEGDYYPTPPCAVDALLEAVRSGFVPELTVLFDRRAPMLDPAAGSGTLLSWLSMPEQPTFAIELNKTLVQQCRMRVPPDGVVFEGDALLFAWPTLPRRASSIVVMNPPFSALRAFVDKALAHIAEHGGAACVLHPAQWSHTKEQSDLPLGDRAELTWRPRFIPGTKSSPSQTYVWEIWTQAMVLRPRSEGRYMRLKRPPEDKVRVEEHARIAGAIGRLGIGTEEAA